MNEFNEYKIAYIYGMAKKMSEDVAVVLAYLSEAMGGTTGDIMKRTALEKNRARQALLLLDVTNFVQKVRVEHSWMYTISDEGRIALGYLLDEKLYPGRSIKVKAILGGVLSDKQ